MGVTILHKNLDCVSKLFQNWLVLLQKEVHSFCCWRQLKHFSRWSVTPKSFSGYSHSCSCTSGWKLDCSPEQKAVWPDWSQMDPHKAWAKTKGVTTLSWSLQLRHPSSLAWNTEGEMSACSWLPIPKAWVLVYRWVQWEQPSVHMCHRICVTVTLTLALNTEKWEAVGLNPNCCSSYYCSASMCLP